MVLTIFYRVQEKRGLSHSQPGVNSEQPQCTYKSTFPLTVPYSHSHSGPCRRTSTYTITLSITLLYHVLHNLDLYTTPSTNFERSKCRLCVTRDSSFSHIARRAGDRDTLALVLPSLFKVPSESCLYSAKCSASFNKQALPSSVSKWTMHFGRGMNVFKNSAAIDIR